MKTLHRIKILPLGIFTAIAFTFPLLSLAVPWSEKHAFCWDTTIFDSAYLSNYSNQKRYNKCMDNADELIAENEKFIQDSKIEWNKNVIANRNKRIKSQEEEWKKQKEEEERKKLENDQEIKKYDDLFSQF